MWKMSSAQSQSTMESELEALQCHFNWDLNCSRSKLFCLKDHLEDIGTEDGYSWLGHIYNLQGFIHYQLGFSEDACRFFRRATEAFCQMRETVSDEGPWLVVNYGNLAWLYHRQGEKAKSQFYLTKISALMDEYPSPSQDELHPEVYAEKAWTLMKFNKDKKVEAIEYFQRAIRMQPDMVEWQTSHALVLVSAKKRGTDLDHATMEKMRIATEHDPENLNLAALYLTVRAQKGTKIEDEVRALGRKVFKTQVSSYSGFKRILMLYRIYLSVDEAIDLVEEALERHPNERYLKWCAANCYKWRIYSRTEDSPRSMMDRAISLCKEVISLYPHSSLKIKIALANIYVKANEQHKGDQIYEELLRSDLDNGEKQLLYSFYAKHLYFSQNDSQRSIEYHMKAAAIPNNSPYRDNSIEHLKKITARDGNREIEEFLLKLQH